ncbi:hypothetical protein LTR86_010185 [Recurvomyces mirabilis]|nr:hypothetical protein LTR86_010185 [Recurvomyces mirabilis]
MAVFGSFNNLSYPHLVLALLAAVVVHVVGTCIYRLHFHHLAKYPGPFWARLSAWPSYLQTVKGNRHVWLYELHQKYGPIVRYRPDAVVMNTPEAYRAIFGPKSNIKKTESYYRVWPHNINFTNTWECDQC